MENNPRRIFASANSLKASGGYNVFLSLGRPVAPEGKFSFFWNLCYYVTKVPGLFPGKLDEVRSLRSGKQMRVD